MPKPENIVPHTFDKRPENINRKGRPKRLVGNVLQELKEQGYAPITAAEIAELYKTLININSDDLKIMAEDSKQPIINKVIIKAIISGKGFEVVEKMLDRAIGKPEQKVTMPEQTDAVQIIINHTPKLPTNEEGIE
jgi:hypothetical protein